MSAALTPVILEACPTLMGLIWFSWSLASWGRPGMLL